ncbi:MAG: glycosyltransferase [Lachnospiraceae bacterium]|nr:glycosyltransferase [Lachnospiraceae bacterium]MBR4575171.1 glycosyltransferase [Lachnospiraceae bacterium]
MKKRTVFDPLAEARRLEQERIERERQEMIMAQNDISVISLDNNIENEFIGQGMTDPEPELLYTKEEKRTGRALGHLETRRVMLVNTVVGTGSVGRLVEGLYNTLIANGYECMVAYGRDTHPEGMNAYRIGQDMDVYIHGALSRLTDRHGFYSKRATLEFINVIEEFAPDIIHLHNVHGYYLNIRVLFEYLKKSDIRVIWTLHDCWAFTGHCSHFEYVGCTKWINGCYACEQLAEYPRSIGKDNSQKNYEDKKELFTGFSDLTIVTPSQWLKARVEQSFLGQYHTVVVPTGIDTSVFAPVPEERRDDNLVFRLRNSLNLRNKNVLLGVANPWRTRKGLMQFVNLSKLINERCVIVLVGLNDEQMGRLPESIIGIGHTDSVEELAALYSMADIYVNLTLEDTFPTTNIEAIACGTPVITYRSGGSAESIDDSCGIAVERNSVQGVVAAIDTILSQKGMAYTTQDCVRHAMLYDKEVRFEEYIREVYEGM